jgi:outer membrane lipoprotein-sorting protein
MKAFVYLSISTCLSSGLLVAQLPQADANFRSQPRPCSLLSLPPSRLSSVGDAELLAAYNSQAHAIRSLHAVMLVRVRLGKESGLPAKRDREIPVTVDILKPDLIHVKGGIPYLGNGGFEMVSDGHEFRLFDPERGKATFLEGPADAPIQSQPNSMENIRPQALVDALQWREGKRRKSMGRSPLSANTDTRTLEVDVTSARGGSHSQNVVFDLRDGLVNSVATYDSAGHLILEASYGDWKAVANSGAGPSAGCFPRRIQVVQPGNENQLDIRILELTLNPEIPKSRFLLSPPQGVPIVRLDMTGKRIAP